MPQTEAQKRAQKKYREANKDKIKERRLKYNLENKDKIKEKTNEYYLENKEKIKEQTNIYRKANKDKIKEKQKEYNIENKDKRKQYREANKEKTKEYHKEYSKTDKRKQTRVISCWIKGHKIKFVDRNEAEFYYERYINTHRCTWCDKMFEDSRERQLDHCHTCGLPRAIICRECNFNDVVPCVSCLL